MKVIFPLERKAYPVLIVYSNAVLPLPISLQRFQMICVWNFQILQTSCIVNHDQFPQCHSLNILRELPGKNLVVDFLSFPVSEVLYHTASLYLLRMYMSNGYINSLKIRYKLWLLFTEKFQARQIEREIRLALWTVFNVCSFKGMLQKIFQIRYMDFPNIIFEVRRSH